MRDVLVIAESEALAREWMRCSGADPASCDVAADPYYVGDDWVVTHGANLDEYGIPWFFDEYEEVVRVGNVPMEEGLVA